MTTDQESELLARITSNPAMCGGQPCLRGMRIRVVDVLEMLAHKVPEAQILKDFPDLEPEDIQASLLFAAERTGHARLVA